MTRFLRAVTVALIIASAGLGLAVLGVGIRDMWQTNQTLLARGVILANQSARDLWDCREAEFQRLVPKGARVFIAPNPDVEMQQRLGEFASSWAILVSRRSEAQIVVDVASQPAGCGGGVALVAAPS